MKSSKSYRSLLSILLFAGFTVSAYLLYHHLNLKPGKPLSSDLCRIIFSKGCDTAMLSRFSSFLHIPMGGWGLIYITTIGLFISFSYWFSDKLKTMLTQTAFWISFAGITGSSWFMIMMIRFPALFCPFCTVFHVINYILFIVLKKETRLSFKQLFTGLFKAIAFVFADRSLNYKFKPVYWILFIFPMVTSLAIFQWVRMEGMKSQINRLAAYSPLEELIKFDNSECYEIELTPDDPMLGAADAPVEMIVFSDFQCGMCQIFVSNFKELIEFNSGNLKIYYKYFPLGNDCNPLVAEGGHPYTCEAAYASEAARLQGKFWAFHDSLNNVEIYNNDVFYRIASNMNLDVGQLKTDMESGRSAKKVKEDVELGVNLKLEGTPSVFLNGHLVRDLRSENLNFLIRYLKK